MVTKAKVFISYRNVDSSRQAAEKLATRLRADEYDVFWDLTNLGVGDRWAQTIYDNIYDSDVLLVLLEEETAESDWVQREVDVARGAHVEIMPISLSDTIDESDTIKRLALRDVQFLRLHGLGDSDADYQKIIAGIAKLAKRTEDAQSDLMDMLKKKRRGNPAQRNPQFATFGLRRAARDDVRRVYLATGDITELRNIDILVNTENDFMQMARVHENNTVSSRLRYEGSLINGKAVLEDTVQHELDAQVKLKYSFQPIGTGNVVITSAGHKQSRLRDRKKIQYLIHAATVEVTHNNRQVTMTPIETDEGIQSCVINCLEAVAEIDNLSGVISPEGEWRLEQEQKKDKYQPMRSIAFPLFGAGHGGRSTAEIVPPMLRGVIQFWRDNPDSPLTEIYLCVYRERDVPVVYEKMCESFERVADE